MQIAVPKGRSVSDSSYKNVVLKKNANKNENSSLKTGLQHVHLLHGNAPAHKYSTVAQFLKSEKVKVLSRGPYSPDLAPCDFFLFRKLKATPFW